MNLARTSLLGLSCLMIAASSTAAPSDKEGPPPLTYQIISVRLTGGGTDEVGSVMLEQQSGRSWILVQRGSAPPSWQALSFESGFTLNQQLTPPDLVRPSGSQK